MLTNPQPPRIHLPKGWQDCVKSAVLHAIALAHYAIVYARAWAADSINARVVTRGGERTALRRVRSAARRAPHQGLPHSADRASAAAALRPP